MVELSSQASRQPGATVREETNHAAFTSKAEKQTLQRQLWQELLLCKTVNSTSIIHAFKQDHVPSGPAHLDSGHLAQMSPELRVEVPGESGSPTSIARPSGNYTLPESHFTHFNPSGFLFSELLNTALSLLHSHPRELSPPARAPTDVPRWRSLNSSHRPLPAFSTPRPESSCISGSCQQLYLVN